MSVAWAGAGRVAESQASYCLCMKPVPCHTASKIHKHATLKRDAPYLTKHSPRAAHSSVQLPAHTGELL